VPPRKLPTEPPEEDGAIPVASSPSHADEDELAQAEARAEAARSRATLLRRQADAASNGHRDHVAHDEPALDWPSSRRRRLRRPGRKALTASAAVVVIGTSLAGSGGLVWHHRMVAQQMQRAAKFSATARDAVVAMMTIEPGTARDDMQRFVDDTTGLFKASILMGAERYLQAVQESKISSKVAVQAVGVESMTEDSAVVLVAAKSELTKPNQAKPAVRSMRVVVSVEEDNGQPKVSRLEFVP